MSLGITGTQIAFQSYLAMVANRCGLKLRFTPQRGVACTDRKTFVVVPESTLTKDRELLAGFILHEAGHCRFTDHEKGGTRLFRDLTNIIEDIRMEAKMCDVYRGASSIFGNLAKKVLGSANADEVKKSGEANPAIGFVNFTLTTAGLFSRDGSRAFPKLQKILHESMNQMLPGIADEAMAILSGIPTLSTSKDSQEMAKKLEKLFLKKAKSSSSASSGNKDSSNSQNEQQGQQGQSGKEGEGKDGGNDGESQSSANDSSSSSNQPGSGSGSPDNLQRMLDDYGQKAESSESLAHQVDFGTQMHVKKGKPSDADVSYAYSPDVKPPTKANNPERGRTRLLEARRDGNALVRSLRSFVEAKAETDEEVASSGRKIKASKLHRVQQGSLKVFLRGTEDPEASNMAVTVLLDMSGSMSNNEKEAINACLALKTALSQFAGDMQTTSSVMTFAHRPGHGDVEKIVGHNEPMTQEVLGRIGAIESFGGTPGETAIKVGALDLLRQTRATRRVMFFITDGYFSVDNAVLDEIRKEGIEVYGLGIGESESESLKAVLGERNVVTLQTGSMAKSVFELARRLFN